MDAIASTNNVHTAATERSWKPMQRLSHLLLACGLSCLLLAGCAPWATYPPVEVTQSLVRPSFEPIPTLMARAIEFAHERYKAVDEIVINLPEGVQPNVYKIVLRKIGQGRPMLKADEKAYHVKTIRTRGPEAEIDLVYPRSDGLHEMVTIHFKQSLVRGFEVETTRLWRIHEPMPAPHYDGPVEAYAAETTSH